MPFKSQAQRRFFHAAASRGEIPDKTVRRWEKETPKDHKLPERVMRKKADTPLEEAIESREDTSRVMLRELAKIRDPHERKRYLADMSARNHRLAMTHPKTASFDVGVIDAMEKVARAASDEDRQSQRGRVMMGVGGAMAGRGVAGAAMGPAQQRLIESIKHDKKTQLSPAEVDKMKAHLKIPGAKHQDIKDWKGSVAVPKGGASPRPLHGLERAGYEAMGHKGAREAMKSGKPGTAYAPRHAPEIVGHELGHLSLRKKAPGRVLLRHTRALGGTAGSVAGGAMAAGGERGGTAVKAAPFVAAAGQLPTLIDEGVSSVRGYKAMKKARKFTPAQLKGARRNLAKAFGSYGMGAAAATLPVAAISAMRWRKKKDR